jgi:hypothetical protein
MYQGFEATGHQECRDEIVIALQLKVQRREAPTVMQFHEIDLG